MNQGCMHFSPDLIAKIVRCLEDALGDDLLADIQRNGLQTRNSIPARAWDLLNTNLINSLDAEDCLIAKAHRGPWEMLIIYEKTTQCILTFMREKRFLSLKKAQRNRKHMHYVDMLAKAFNKELIADQRQTSLFPHSFSDEDRLAALVANLLQDLHGDVDVVRHHVLVLFETAGFQLTHVRAIMVTPDLEIAKGCEEDWSKYISSNESTVVQQIVHPDAPENHPEHGLALKPKAIARKKNIVKCKEQELVKEG